jgi:3-oxoadipate enol-lactonase
VSALVISGSWGGFQTLEVGTWHETLKATVPAGRRPGLFHSTFAEREPNLLFLYREITALTPDGPGRLAGGLKSIGEFRADVSPIVTHQIPVLFMAGEEDGIVPAMQSVAKMIPRARFDVVPGAGHSAYFERADYVTPIIARFLREYGK